MLEKKVFVENGEIPPVVGELKHKVEHLREKLEVRWQHISFINICRQCEFLIFSFENLQLCHWLLFFIFLFLHHFILVLEFIFLCI